MRLYNWGFSPHAINEIPQISARMKASTFIKADSWSDLFKRKRMGKTIILRLSRIAFFVLVATPSVVPSVIAT
jgi:hypothetical protein